MVGEGAIVVGGGGDCGGGGWWRSYVKCEDEL